MPRISSLGTAAAAACVVCTLLGAIRHETIPPKSTVGHSALLGAFIFCGAQIALLLRPHDVGGSDLLLAASLIPVVIAVTLAATTEAGLSTVVLLAGIAAATSLLLLFPEPRIHTLAGASVLVLLPVMTGVGAALLHTDISQSPLWSSASACAGTTLTLAVSHLLRAHRPLPISWQAVGLDVVTLLCTLLALRRLGAVKYSACFALVPIILLLYGFVVMRPGFTVRNVSGLLLLAASSVVLLRYRGEARGDSTFRLLA